MLLGYARVSTIDQKPETQIEELRKAGCERIFHENASGGRWDRPELHRLLDQLRPGDVVVVWKLDRLSRSLKDLLSIIEKIQSHRAEFKSLTEVIDTTSAGGRMMMQMIGSFAEYEREMFRERSRIGMEAAKKQGRAGGRKFKLTKCQQDEIIELIKSGKKTAADASRLFNVSPATICRLLQRNKD